MQLDESIKTKGLHLKIGTLHFPPYIFVDQEHGSVYGIEPSFFEILAEKLNFTFEYSFAKPTEMWGDVVQGVKGPDVIITGLTGMLYRGEIDVAFGDYYSPFQLPVWIAILFSIAFASLLLYLAAKREKIVSTFKSANNGIFFVFTNVIGVGRNHGGVTRYSTINRLLFGIWLLCALVLSLSYQSVLISFMTSPRIPPPIDTIQQLVDSSLGKIAYADFFKTFLLLSTIPVMKELGQQMTVTYNLTYMYSLMDSDSWAIQSSKENLNYVVAKYFKETGTENRMHLMKECVWPFLRVFGLPNDSPLKRDFDYQIQRLFEAGLIQYHHSKFTKVPTDPTVTKTKSIKGLSLHDLEGAFYLLIVGFIASFVCFLMEQFIHCLKNNLFPKIYILELWNKLNQIRL